MTLQGLTFRTAISRGLNVQFLASAGMLSDAFTVSKFGFNPNIVAAVETVWDAGGVYPWQSPGTGLTMTLQSTLAADDVLGTGARYVTIFWIDKDYNQQQTTVETDGTNPVAVGDDIYLPYRMVVTPGPNGEAAAGSGQTAAGTITLENTATVYSQIINGNNQTLMALYTIPAGFTGYIMFGKASVGEGKTAEGKFFVRPLNGVFNLAHDFLLFQNSYDYPFGLPVGVNEKSDLDLRAISTAAGTTMSGAFDVIIVRNL